MPFLRLKDLSGGKSSKDGKRKGKGGKKGSDDEEFKDAMDSTEPGSGSKGAISLLMFQLNPMADLDISGDGVPDMDITKPCEFTAFGAMDVTKPYELMGS